MTLIIMRHGESHANQNNIFTGWLDVPLTEKGVRQAHLVAEKLAAENIQLDYVFTSVMGRTIKTATIILEDLGQLYLPVEKTWRLNERHYGAWQGLNKTELAAVYGADKLEKWRRSYSIRPPLAEAPTYDRRYRLLDYRSLPMAESLADTLVRMLPCWQDQIFPLLKEGKNVLVVSHGNSLRALMKYLENISDEAIEKVVIATGEMVWYDLAEDFSLRKNLFK